MLSLQADSVQDRKVLEAFSESQSRIKVMALVHEKLYASANLSSIEMETYIRSLAVHLVQSHAASDRIGLKIDVDQVMLGIDLAIPCGLILNELLSNALKHAFPEGKKGEVIIELRPESEQQLLFVVRDTGIGMPAHLDIGTVDSLGLRLVGQLIEQLEGHLQVGREGGTTFTIRFPSVLPHTGGAHVERRIHPDRRR